MVYMSAGTSKKKYVTASVVLTAYGMGGRSWAVFKHLFSKAGSRPATSWVNVGYVQVSK